MPKMTDDELKALISNEVKQSFGYGSGKLEEMRRRNEYYFLGLPQEDLAPPEIEGRSSVVDTTVRNTILGMEAPLIKTFYGTENVVEFEETNEDDADKAKQATDYVNYILRKKNPGYTIVSTWIRDALLLKKGFIKVWWDDSKVETREEYRGQTDIQLAILLDDEEVEPIEQKSYPDADAEKQKKQAIDQISAQIQQLQQAAQQPQPPQQLGQQPQQNPAMQQLQQAMAMLQNIQAQPVPMLYDVSVKRVKTGGRVCIENVPPDEFLISKSAKRIVDASFCGHRLQRTISDLKSMGYKNVDDLSGGNGDTDGSINSERVERITFDDSDAYSNEYNDNVDPSQRLVWIIEAYVKVDMDGNGIAEWRKVVMSGNTILENVECDGPPFVDLCPIPLSHRFFGLCPADLAVEPQRISTSLLRAQLDNVYLQVNGRYFAVEGQVNLDDLLTSRPGGVVRVKSAGAAGRLDQGTADSGHAMELMGWFQEFTEESTGWTRQSQGGNGLSVSNSNTLGEANIVTNRADSRIELISRTFAETGFSDLFKMILKLVTQYQNKSEMVKLGGKWQNIDPREWTNQFDLSINVGLGTGNKDQQVQHLMALGQKQGESLQIGVSTPKNIYNANVKLAEALGFKNGDQFFTDPDAPPDPNAPPKPPPAPDPHIVKAQIDAQQRQQQHAAELQFKTQEANTERQHQAELEQMKAHYQAQSQMAIDRNRQEAEAQQKLLEIQQQAELERLKEQYKHEQALGKMALEKQKLEMGYYKVDRDSDTKIVTAQIAAQQANDAALLAAENSANQDIAGGDNVNG